MSERKKDDIIQAQLEIIKQMTEGNLRRVGEDLWGAGVLPDEIFSADKSGKVSHTEDKNTKGVKNENAGEKSIFGNFENFENKDTSVKKNPESASEEKCGDGAKEPPEKIEVLLEELDSYIGLEKVKSEVRGLINLAKVYALRRENGLPVHDMSLHMVFSGNPGTGKTMIARFMARVYRSLGLLEKGHLTECDRAGLVAGYVGQTAQKTEKVCREALGGVLFIDEAYTLVSKGEGDFGTEAVDTLLKFMEDNRGSIVVIAAGYTELMEDFINSNPGLESRFNKYLNFQDYTPKEMGEIFALNCRKGMYVVTDEARAAAEKYFEGKEHDTDFGNARGVRNFFERVLAAQANRVVNLTEVTREALSEITVKDIEAAAEGPTS